MYNLNLDALGVSTEDIKFQGMSNLSIEMINLFNEGIEKKQEFIREDPKEDVVYNKMKKFTTDTLYGKFATIVKKNVGLKIDRIETAESGEGFFACYMYLGPVSDDNLKLAWEIRNAYSANAMNNKTLPTVKNKFASMLDLDGGFINNTKDIEIPVAFIFDISAAFFFRDNGGERDFNGPEIAAIMIHEIGHMFSMLEHSADGIVRHEAALEYAGSEGESMDSKLTRLETVSKMVQKKVKDSKLSSKSIDSLLKMSEVVHELPKKNPSMFARFGHMIGLIIVILLVALLSIYSVVYGIVGTVVLGSFGGDKPIRAKRKVSDFGYSTDTVNLVERYADAYVSRHGLGKYIITGLDNLMGKAPTATIRDSRIAFGLTKAAMNVLNWTMSTGQPYAYEDGYKRAKRMMQNILKSMKSSNMSPEVVDIFIADYERTAKAFENTKNSHKAKTTFPAWIANNLSLPALVSFLMKGNNDKDYQKFQKDLEEFANTKLFYQAEKLKQIARRK